MGAWEHQKLPELHERLLKDAETAAKPRKSRKPKGPNPLSCLKPKKKGAAGVAQNIKIVAVPPNTEELKNVKRARSRRMGTRTRAEAEARLLSDRGFTPSTGR